MRMGLLMGNDSRRRREYLGEKLRIGYSNGKQLLKRLELFGITLAEVEEAMERYEDEKSCAFTGSYASWAESYS